MATVIRFARFGKKKKPFYRIVVQDSRAPRDGRHVDHIGHYNPMTAQDELVVKRDRLEFWLSTGAQMSASVRSRLRGLMKEWGLAATGGDSESKKAQQSAAKEA